MHELERKLPESEMTQSREQHLSKGKLRGNSSTTKRELSTRYIGRATARQLIKSARLYSPLHTAEQCLLFKIKKKMLAPYEQTGDSTASFSIPSALYIHISAIAE